MTEFDYLDKLKEEIDASQKQPVQPLDPERFKAFIKAPLDIPEEEIFQLADIIDGRFNIRPRRSQSDTDGPETVDRLLNSTTIVYIEDDGIPIAVASIIDPTIENYKGYVPLSLYSLHSANNLEGRVQLEFFAVSDEYRNTAVPNELNAQVKSLNVPLFMVTDADDDDTNEWLLRTKCKMASVMNIDSNNVPVILWLN